VIRAAVLTVSDSTFRGEREDISGPRVGARLRESGFEIAEMRTVPDERSLIAQALRELAAEPGCEAVFTTGGTGVAHRDVTPEATRDVLEKELPGLGEIMRTEGLKHTRRAVLSRGTAGTFGRCLVINLPGSPKGAVQSLDAILDLVPHVVELLRGNTAHGEEVKRS
jgi:molybdenum cofactor synthesis domain-containing protein